LANKPSRVQLVIQVNYKDRDTRNSSIASLEYRNAAKTLVMDFCESKKIQLLQLEDNYRSESGASEGRRRIFEEVNRQTGLQVATGHTLDDAYEWYLIRTLGVIKADSSVFMRVENSPVYRPFLYTKKKELLAYAVREGVPFLADPTNSDPSNNARAKIRMSDLIQTIHGVFDNSITTFRKRLINTNEQRED
jgi:tRNA(Ile)-lysidine synthase TilS/MesJ